jgi:hypothetical protein
MDLGRRSFPTAAGWFFAPRRCWLRWPTCRCSPLVPSPLAGEGSMVRSRTRMGEGFRDKTTPSPIIACGSAERPSPARGEGTCNEHRACTSSHDVKQPISFPRRVLRPGFATLLRQPESRVGGAPRDVRVLGGTPVGHAITRHARRLRGALRPMTRDARLSALHRGGFGLPGPRFRLLGRPPSYNGGQVPCGSVQRAPRTQVVVPGGRGPCLPGRAVTSRRRRTPRLAPHSGSSLEHALNERGWEAI